MDCMKTPRDWHAGTGEYEGMVWDGRNWLKAGEAQKLTPWQKTTLPWRIVLWVVAGFALVVAGAVYSLV